MHAPQPGPVDPWEFRRVVGRFATGVSVATTVHEGVAHGMTVNSLTSVSLDPVLVLICVERTASFHDPVVAAGHWALSVLSEDMEADSRFFATREHRGLDQFEGRAVRPGPVTGAPVFDRAIAVLECLTWAVYDGGDHSIVVGEVVGLDCPRDAAPLIYYRGGYRDLRND